MELLTFLLGLAFYFLPAIIAIVRDHRNKVAILLTNLLLGWTGIVWLVALIWAFTNSQPHQVIINNSQDVAK